MDEIHIGLQLLLLFFFFFFVHEDPTITIVIQEWQQIQTGNPQTTGWHHGRYIHYFLQTMARIIIYCLELQFQYVIKLLFLTSIEK